MKKFVIITLIFAMAAGAAFAQTADGISINAWGRGVFAPIQVIGKAKTAGKVDKTFDNDGKEVEVKAVSHAGTGVTWGGNLIRSDFRINGNAEFVGFQIQLSGENASTNDNQYIWAKPFSNDILKLYVGHFDVDDLRGKVDTDTGFENFVVGDLSADTIFHRFRAGGGDPNGSDPNNFALKAASGFMLSSAPMEGLFIGFRVNGDLFRDWEGDGSGHLAGDAYRFMQAGAGYNIDGIGHIRAQYIGGWFGKMTEDKFKKIAEATRVKKYSIEPIDFGDPTDPKYDPDDYPKFGDTARIEAAFALTAIDNLLIDLGLKFWLPLSIVNEQGGGVTVTNKASNGINVALGAKFRMEAFQIVAHINSGFGSYDNRLTASGGGVDSKYNKDKQLNGLSLGVNLIPTFDLEAFTIGASLGMRMTGASTYGWADEFDDPDNKCGNKLKDNTAQFGFGGFVQKGLGSGNVKAGLAYRTAKTTDGKANGSGVFTIPVILEYAFF